MAYRLASNQSRLILTGAVRDRQAIKDSAPNTTEKRRCTLKYNGLGFT